MARRHKPQIYLEIQSLSTGEPIRQQAEPDDFGGEPIVMAEVYGPFKPPRAVDTLERERSERKQAQAQALLYKAGWYGHKAKPSGPIKRRM